VQYFTPNQFPTPQASLHNLSSQVYFRRGLTLIFVVPITHVQTATKVHCLRYAAGILFLLLLYFHTIYLQKHINLLCTVKKEINKGPSDTTLLYNTNITILILYKIVMFDGHLFIYFFVIWQTTGYNFILIAYSHWPLKTTFHILQLSSFLKKYIILILFNLHIVLVNMYIST